VTACVVVPYSRTEIATRATRAIISDNAWDPCALRLSANSFSACHHLAMTYFDLTLTAFQKSEEDSRVQAGSGPKHKGQKCKSVRHRAGRF